MKKCQHVHEGHCTKSVATEPSLPVYEWVPLWSIQRSASMNMYINNVRLVAMLLTCVFQELHLHSFIRVKI